MAAFRIIALFLSLLLYFPVKLLWWAAAIFFSTYCHVSRFGTGTSGPVIWNDFDVTIRFNDGWWN